MDARRLTLLFALAVSGSSAAVSQTTISPALSAAPSPALRAACGADVQKFCSGVQPGGGRIVECMKGYVRELSPGCLAAARAEIQARHATLAR